MAGAGAHDRSIATVQFAQVWYESSSKERGEEWEMRAGPDGRTWNGRQRMEVDIVVDIVDEFDGEILEVGQSNVLLFLLPLSK